MLGSPKYSGTSPAQPHASLGKLLNLPILVSSVKMREGETVVQRKARDDAEEVHSTWHPWRLA